MIRLVEKGKWNQDILRLIETNVRVPKWVIGDLRAMVAANIAAENRIHTIIEKYGMQDYLHYREVVKQLTENTLRQRIRSIPNGSFSCEDFVEHDGHTDSLFKIRLNLTVADEHLVLDFRGSDPQTQGIINGTYQTTVGFATSPIVMMLAWDLPPNSGLLNCFSVITDKNSICDASPPAPTSSAHADSGLRVCKMVNIVLARAAKRSSDPQITDRIVGNFHDNWPIVTFVSDRDQRGQYTVFSNMDASGSGGGALQSRDGLDCAAPSTSLNMLIPDAEMSEMNYPVLYLWRRLYKDSGGPGMYRGGLGINLAWTPTVSDMMGVVSNQSMHAPPRGIFGGYPGAVSQEIRIRGSNVLSR